ncbi:MAG: hypothetical protein GY853_06855 [PVC group bacterium]|nr:hypothetical protein [PVC group bacterium]
MEHVKQNCKICIGPTTDFTPGVSLEYHCKFGGDYDKEVEKMSGECKSAAVVFGTKFTLSNPEAGSSAVETLNSLKEMAAGIPQVQEMLEKGVDVSFRHEGANVWVNVRVPENVPELQAIPGFDKITLSGAEFTGIEDFVLSSGLDPTHFPETQLEDIIERASNFKIEGSANFEDLQTVLTTILGLVKEFLPDDPKVLMGMSFVNILTAFRVWNFDFKYDAQTVRTVVKNMIEASGKIDKAKEKIAERQGIVKEFLPQAQAMAPMFIGPYADLLKSVNLGHFEFFAMIPKVRTHIVAGLTLFGLNKFLNDKFLSD